MLVEESLTWIHLDGSIPLWIWNIRASLIGTLSFTCEAEEYENRGSASILFLRGNDRGHVLLKSMYLLTYLFQKIKERTSNTWMKPICTPSLAVIVLAFFLEYAYEPIKYKQWISWVTRTNLASRFGEIPKFRSSWTIHSRIHTDFIAPVRREIVPVKPQTPKKMILFFFIFI